MGIAVQARPLSTPASRLPDRSAFIRSPHPTRSGEAARRITAVTRRTHTIGDDVQALAPTAMTGAASTHSASTACRGGQLGSHDADLVRPTAMLGFKSVP